MGENCPCMAFLTSHLFSPQRTSACRLVSNELLGFGVRTAHSGPSALADNPATHYVKAAIQSFSGWSSPLGSLIIRGQTDLNRFGIQLIHSPHRNAN